MMPVPSHLTNSVVPKTSIIDESPLDADVRCSCGSPRFDLLFTGETHEYDGETIPCVAQIDGNFFFIIKALCKRCNQEHLLLDSDYHGWIGFVCHDPKQAALPRPQLLPWKCLGCGATEHEASVQIQTEGKDDFLTEAGKDFDLERWPDAFGWFTMAIKCVGCGKNTPEWVSYETM